MHSLKMDGGFAFRQYVGKLVVAAGVPAVAQRNALLKLPLPAGYSHRCGACHHPIQLTEKGNSEWIMCSDCDGVASCRNVWCTSQLSSCFYCKVVLCDDECNTGCSIEGCPVRSICHSCNVSYFGCIPCRYKNRPLLCKDHASEVRMYRRPNPFGVMKKKYADEEFELCVGCIETIEREESPLVECIECAREYGFSWTERSKCHQCGGYHCRHKPLRDEHHKKQKTADE